MDELRAVWRVADEAGFDHVWNFDHFASIRDDTTGDIFEAWTLLGAMAEATSSVRIGCMVTGNTYRHPGVLAKMAVTVDHLSGGRLEFGLGAAWAEVEHTMLGLEFGTVGQRIARLEEACRVVKALWTEDRASFAGDWYRLEQRDREPEAGAEAVPADLDRRHRRAQDTPGRRRARRRLELLRARGRGGARGSRVSWTAHCDAVGRDPARGAPLAPALLPGTWTTSLARSRALRRRGFTELIVYVAAGDGEADGDGGRRSCCRSSGNSGRAMATIRGRGRLAQLVRAPL